ncbi:unnamed protein product [Alopecurus aequalis]
MDESRKRAASNANAKNISSSLDEDFGNDFLSSWKVPKPGKDTIDFDVESVPKNSKKFSFDNLDDFGLDGAFDKMPSFKMGMSDLDFSSPLKKKPKHSSSNENDLSEGQKETEKDNFFSFDFNDLGMGKFNLDTKLDFEEKGTSKITEKTDPISSEGNKDRQRGISDKGTDVPEDSKSKEQTQTHDACTLKPTNLTSINPARVEQPKVDMVSNDMLGENSNEAQSTKPAVNNSSHSFPCSAVSAEDPTHSKAKAVPENSKEAPAVELSKLNISRENSNNEQEVGSQSRNTSTENPYISRRPVGKPDSKNNQNEAVEESTSLSEGSHGSQYLGGTLKPLRKTSSGTKNVEGTSGPKNLSSSMQREIRNVKPALVNETGTFSLLSKSANTKASRPLQVTSETTLNQLSGANNVIHKTNTHPTDLKREHKHAQPEKLKITSAKPYCKPGLQGLSTTSLNAKHGLEPLSAGNSAILNAPSNTAHRTEHNNATSQILLKSSKPSDVIQDTPSKDGKRPTTSQLAGSRVLKVGTRSRSPMSGLLVEKDSLQVSGSKDTPVITSKIPNSFVEGKPASRSPSMRQNMPEESIPDTKAPTVLKRIMRFPAVRKSPQTVSELGNKIILSGTPKTRMDNVVSSTTPCEMGDISDLELPALLEDDGNVDKAEACRKELEDMCILLKRKHTEAKELAVRAIVNNNMLLMLNHPMFEEKMSALQKFANSLRSKKHLFEEISAIDTH